MKVTRNWRKEILFFFFACVTNGAMAMDSTKQSVGDLITGNTLFVGNRFGPSFVYFDPSGIFRATGGDGVISEGTWRATEDSVCTTTTKPNQGGKGPEFCLNILGRKIGESWNGDDSKNGKLVFKLIPGNTTSLK